MALPAIRDVTAADEAAVVDTIVLAFAADPVPRWVWPCARDYLAAMPKMVRAFGGGAFGRGALCTADHSGAALWLPPGVDPDEDKLGEVMQSTVAPERRNDVFAAFEQMAKFHPSEPHWYLPLIGVDPVHQGNGRGDALMVCALERCDRERAPAYLEATNARNAAFYRRHGFEAIGTIQAGSSPPLVPMLRQPR